MTATMGHKTLLVSLVIPLAPQLIPYLSLVLWPRATDFRWHFTLRSYIRLNQDKWQCVTELG